MRNFNIVRVAFTLSCIGLTIYMSAMQVFRYFENNDASTFGNKEFNESPMDIYPTFSYCFKDEFGGIYDKRYFSEHVGLTRDMYQKLLSGELQMFSNDSDTNLANFFDIDVHNVTLKLEDLFILLVMKTVNQSVEQEQRYGGAYGHKFPHLYKSYQDPIKICFTKKSNFEKGIMRQTDEISTVPATHLGEKLTSRVKLEIYIHLDGQLTRAFTKPTWNYGIQTWGIVPKLVSSWIQSDMIKVSVLRKRPDSKYPCDKELTDDDQKFRIEAMRVVGCVPPY